MVGRTCPVYDDISYHTTPPFQRWKYCPMAPPPPPPAGKPWHRAWHFALVPTWVGMEVEGFDSIVRIWKGSKSVGPATAHEAYNVYTGNTGPQKAAGPVGLCAYQPLLSAVTRLFRT